MNELVYAVLSRSVASALHAEAERLNRLAAQCRGEGAADGYGVPHERVEAVDVAVLQVREALLRWPWCLRRKLPREPRDTHCVWLIDDTLQRVLTMRAQASGLSVSDLLARMVHPQPYGMVRDGSSRFHEPAWARLYGLERATAAGALGRPGS